MNINANELINKSRNLSHNKVPSKSFLYTIMFFTLSQNKLWLWSHCSLK